MEGAGATSEGLSGVHQLVFGVEWRAAVRLLVLGAIGGGTGETGAGGGTLHPGADVTPHHLLTGGAGRGGGAPACARRSSPGRRKRKSGGAVTSLFELVGDEGKNFVDAELRTLGKLVLAQGTGADGAGRPVAADARLGQDRRTGEGQGSGVRVCPPALPGRSCVHTAWTRVRQTGPDRWSR